MNQASWLLLVDLDKTIWDCEDISSMRPPFKTQGGNLFFDANGNAVRIKEYMVRFLRWARSRGALVVALSWNIPEVALEALKTTHLISLFDYYAIEFHPRKDMMLLNLARELREKGLYHVLNCIVYIDDSKHHLELVSSIVDACCLQPEVDFNDLASLIKAVSRCLIRCRLKTWFQYYGEQHGDNVPGDSGSYLEHESSVHL
ncbi:MAG: magnesium-dependent phosphatase-1 [Desulfurococcaceae archaeon]